MAFKKKPGYQLKNFMRRIPHDKLHHEVYQIKKDGYEKGFLEFQNCWDSSGFGWDNQKETPTAPDAEWEDYFAVFCTLF